MCFCCVSGCFRSELSPAVWEAQISCKPTDWCSLHTHKHTHSNSPATSLFHPFFSHTPPFLCLYTDYCHSPHPFTLISHFLFPAFFFSAPLLSVFLSVFPKCLFLYAVSWHHQKTFSERFDGLTCHKMLSVFDWQLKTMDGFWNEALYDACQSHSQYYSTFIPLDYYLPHSWHIESLSRQKFK